jgi:cytochrome c
MNMKPSRILILLVAAGYLFIGAKLAVEGGKEPLADREKASAGISFKRDVMPVFQKYCLPCHSEESGNPSEFVAENYETLMKGGKHGPVILAGMPDSSHLVQKISKTPPFGDPMPFRATRAFPKDTLQLLWRWIKEGARNN